MGLQIGQGITISGAVQIIFEQPAAPTNLIPPSIIGDMISGRTVSLTDGTWTGVPITPITYAYAWQLNTVTIPGATTNTLILDDDWAGDTLTATVTATNVIGNTPANAAGRLIGAWSPGLWTVSNTGVNQTGQFNSSDNYIWVAQAAGGSTLLLRSQNGVAWANVSVPISNPTGLLQASDRIIIWKSGSNNAAYSNDDGSNWTYSNITVNTTTNLLSGAFDGANIVIMRGDSGSNSFVRSTNLGNSWANVNIGHSTQNLKDMAYGNGVFLTIGTFGSTVRSNDGGATWANNIGGQGQSIAYGDGKFVTVYPYGGPSNPAYSQVSNDNGDSWISTTLPPQGWLTVVFADNHFVTAEGYGNVMYSDDGINWSTPVQVAPPGTGSGYTGYLTSQNLLLNSAAGYLVTHTNPGGAPTPSQPSNINGSLLTLTSATVTWTAPTEVGSSPISSYSVKAISTDGGANVTQNTSGPVTSYNITTLTTGKTYYFAVAATNTSGTGGYAYSTNTLYITPTIGSKYAGGTVVLISGSMATICSPYPAGQRAGGYTWTQQSAFCSGLVTGGYSDWQMPNLTQMAAVNTNLSYIGGYASGYYWTVTPYNPPWPGWYWMVNMPSGTQTPNNNIASVRAIRNQFF